jgi:hypothetical protein
MRITESALRRIIRETLLAEAAMTPKDANDNGIRFEMSKWKYKTEITAHQDSREVGYITSVLEPGGRHKDSEGEPGQGSPRVWSISLSGTASGTTGLGPLLYDLMIDAISPDLLASDRFTVSPSAKRVWDYYLTSRPDIEAIQLDNPEDFLTPQPDDNFIQQSAMNLDGFEGWPQSSLSKAYRRKDGRTPTLNTLWRLGLLEMT